MNREDAIRKAIKLLKLAESSNPHEAAVAAALAQEIITEHKLNALMFDEENEEAIKFHRDEPLDILARASRWRTALAVIIARHNQCRIVLSGGTLQIIGRSGDAAAVRAMYDHIRQQVDRCASRECMGLGRTYASNFRLGVVDTIDERMGELQRAIQKKLESSERGRYALLRLDGQGADVDAWMGQNMNLSTRRPFAGAEDEGARQHGRIVGHQIELHHALGAAR